MLLLWSMKEKHNNESKFRLYFDTLPENFNTGMHCVIIPNFGVNYEVSPILLFLLIERLETHSLQYLC